MAPAPEIVHSDVFKVMADILDKKPIGMENKKKPEGGNDQANMVQSGQPQQPSQPPQPSQPSQPSPTGPTGQPAPAPAMPQGM
jgi:hypothetical protein